MNEFPPLEAIAIHSPPLVYHIPSTWEHSHTTEEDAEVFTFERFFVQITTRSLVTEDSGKEDPDPRTLLAGANDPEVEIIERGPAVLLSSGLAMIGYSETAEENAVFHLELCGFHAPGRLAVLRYTTTFDEVDLSDPEAAYWLHSFRQLARMTYFEG